MISAQERLGAENADYAPWQLFLLAQLKNKEIKTEDDVEMNAFYGCVIISKGYILTATHCVNNFINLKKFNAFVLPG